MKIIRLHAILLLTLVSGILSGQDATVIIEKVDGNMSSNNRIFKSEMTVAGRRSSRTITSQSYTEGRKQSFTEYLSPAREQGTKMLKKENQLWIYSPSDDRTIQITGQMLRQSVMGSDLSYEDMMEDRKLTDMYNAKVAGKDTVQGRMTYVIELTAKVEDVAYQKRKIWVDEVRFVPLREERYAKSGQLLKRTVMSDVKQVQGRWFPMKIIYKDMLKDGNGTEFMFTSIQFDQPIPDYIFSKAALKK
jgi:outer membrane lipoprotein-sorting protein